MLSRTTAGRARLGVAGLASAAAVAASVLALTPADAATAPGNSANAPGQIRKSCATPGPGQASCHALQRTDVQEPAGLAGKGHGPTSSAVTPKGYGPTDIQSAYNLPSTFRTTAVPTVAIVDAYDDPTAESDLAVYRSWFGLAPCDAPTGAGCVTKVNQTGGNTSYPTADSGWAQEISLDLDMVSAACPSCHILLVEANSASFADLGAAVNYAASQKPAAISNSYGGSDASDKTYSNYYNHPGIAVTVSSGDNGYGAEYPASSQYVVAVGGTSLRHNSDGSWSETAWSGAGSGCSKYNAQPSWQTTSTTGCSTRALADVSAVADPNTGVAVYDSTPHNGSSGWLVFGGTSASS
ncbi:MAG: S53 family peptidase, partial [Actinomycetales bacterium]